MNETLRTTNGYKGLNLAEFSDALNNITGKMLDNDFFPKQQELVKKLVADEESYNKLAEKAKKGSSISKLERNTARGLITDDLKTLGEQVTAVCNGNLKAMMSSGMPHTSGSSPRPPLSQPPAPRLSTGTAKRQIVCVGVKPKGTLAEYLITATPDVEDSWKAYANTRRKYIFKNLEPGTLYFVKYAVIGSKDQRVESDVVSLRPQ